MVSGKLGFVPVSGYPKIDENRRNLLTKPAQLEIRDDEFDQSITVL